VNDNDDGSSVRVTLRDVYDAVNAMREEIGGVPAKVEDHETRLRSLERKLYMFTGVFIVIEVLVVPLTAALLGNVFNK
jgi:hypothetical protein